MSGANQLIAAFRHLDVAFSNVGLRKPVAVIVASQEEIDQIAYFFRGDPPVWGFAGPGRPRMKVSGIEIIVEGGDQVMNPR